MTRALIVVDVQNDFCEGGSLAVDGGRAVAGRITAHLAAHAARYDLVVATRDFHVDPGRHFAPAGVDPDYVDTWPVHCVVGARGSGYHPALGLPSATVHIVKGEHAAAYSGFEGHTDDAAARPLADVLAGAGVDKVEVVGLAESHCVRATAVDAARLGLATTVLTDLTAGVSPETTAAAVEAMAAAGVARRRSS